MHLDRSVHWQVPVKVFVDFVRATGLYEAAQETSWIDPATPTRILTAPGFLRASGMDVLASRRRIYHVESRAYLSPITFRAALVREGDTLVVVNSDDTVFDDPLAVEALWQVTGGAERQVERAEAQAAHA